MNKKKETVILLITLISISLFGLNSEDAGYLLGDYSGLSATAFNGNSAYFDDVFNLLQDANFNSLKFHNWAFYETDFLHNVMAKYNSFGLDMTLADNAWDTNGTGTLVPTYSNSYHFEAEMIDFENPIGVLECADEWFYTFYNDDPAQTRIDDRYDPEASNLFTLRCLQSTSGDGSEPLMAINSITKRDNMIYENDHLQGIIRYTGNMNEYIFTWKMRWEDANPAYPGDAEICKVGLKIAIEDTTGTVIDWDYDDFDAVLHSDDFNSTMLTKSDFESVGAVGDVYQDFIFRINISDIDSVSGSSFRYFCPTVEFRDRGHLFIDNIRIKDDLFEQLENGAFTADIVARLNAIGDPHNNLLKYESLDEPRPGQFQAYGLVDQILANNNSPRLRTAANSHNFDSGYSSNTPGLPAENAYYNERLFNHIAKPAELYPDKYLYSNQGCFWNTDLATYNIQKIINRVTNHYRILKTEADSGTEEIPFIPVVQTFGQWDFDITEWDGIMLSPSEQQKMLMYLPLCYGADGIYTFRMQTDTDISRSGYYDNTNDILNHGAPEISYDENEQIRNRSVALIGIINKNSCGNYEALSQYNAIKEATEKILVYGPIIKELNWDGGGTIATNNPGPLHLNNEFDVALVDNLESVSVSGYGPFYNGYIECGVYTNDNNYQYLMLVNRRTNFVTGCTDGDQKFHFDVNSVFTEADPQEITFHFTDSMESYYLIDQYSGGIYNITNSVSDTILIQPGDGMLLKLCQLPVPEVITGTIYVANEYIPYNIMIQDGGVLYVGNNVEFGPNAQIYISEGSSLIIEGNVTFGTNSRIHNQGVLYIGTYNQSSLIAKHDQWKGIRSKEGSEVWVQNGSLIKDAVTGIEGYECEIHIENSTFENCITAISFPQGILMPGAVQLEFISSTIILPPEEDAIGVQIFNYGYDNMISITGTDDDRLEIIGSDRNGTGINLWTNAEGENSSFICEYTDFSNLETGIVNSPFCKTMYEYTHCEFDNCDTGIDLFGTGRISSINNSTFSNNDIGISQNTVGAKINNNSFYDNVIGIDFSNTYQGNRQEDPYFEVHANQFESNLWDMQCSDSTPRVRSCIFNASVLGIISADNSEVRASHGANNLFNTNYAHLAFIPSDPLYSSGFLLYSGHNDFYNSMWDFYFDASYNGSGITIDADWNWWEDDSVNVGGNPLNPPDIIANRMDENPNVPFIPSPESRFETASYEEHLGNFGIAMNLNRAILDEKLEDEMKYWSICTDNVYNLTFVLEESIYDLIDYFEILYNSLPEYLTVEERDYFQRILKNYQKKCYVEEKEYQSAADIVIERIDNPVSTVDSLFAVMQLETIYTLSEMDSTGRGIAVHTRYDHLSPKSLNEHNRKHNDNWDKIYSIMGFDFEDEEDIEQNIPTTPVLHNNYPNPFNPETTIKFSIPEDSKIKLTIYNIKGQKVKTLVNEGLEKGIHEVLWTGRNDNNKSVASGVYFYKFDVNNKMKSVKKCLMLK